MLIEVIYFNSFFVNNQTHIGLIWLRKFQFLHITVVITIQSYVIQRIMLIYNLLTDFKTIVTSICINNEHNLWLLSMAITEVRHHGPFNTTACKIMLQSMQFFFVYCVYRSHMTTLAN